DRLTALGGFELLGIHPGDLHEAAQRDHPDPVLGLPSADADELRRKEEEEALNPHPGPLCDDEVAELVQHDQRDESREDQKPPADAGDGQTERDAHATASPSI